MIMLRPIEVQLDEVRREIAMRKSVYPGMVGRGKMRQAEADERIARMEPVLAVLEHVAGEIAGSARP